jgi:ketosteroid isomerase-like protein
MRTRSIAVLMLALLASAGCSRRSDRAIDVEGPRVRAALDGFFAAVAGRDWQRVDALVADDFEFYGDNLMVLSRAEFITAMKDDQMNIRTLELSQVQTSVSDDGRLAWVKYHAYLDSDVKGKPYRMNSAETVAFRREGDTWRMTHNHASIREIAPAPPARH